MKSVGKNRTCSRFPLSTLLLPLSVDFSLSHRASASGDPDGRVPVTSTRYSLNVLKLPVKSSWRPWFLKREVGGYTMEYKGDITLVTVRGAGHEDPSYQPPRALALIQSFLLGKPLPSS